MKISAAAFIACLAGPLPAAAQSIAGEWNAAYNTPGGARTFSILFVVDGEKLTGTVKRPAGNSALTGTVKGNAVRFSYTVEYNGNALPLTVTATVAADSMRGVVDFGGSAEEDFWAARASAPPPEMIQYRSAAGVEYRGQPDTGAVARARQALAADPGNVDLMIRLAVAHSGARQFREAIETLTRGVAIAPDNPLLYRWRGHRYLSIREFGRAKQDLLKGFSLDSTNYGILYHLGIVRMAEGDFAGAADAFRRALPLAPDAAERTGATDWLWMAEMRAGRSAEAAALLAARPDSIPVRNAYAQRLRLYRGELGPDAVVTPADTADVQVATLSYGIGNWHLVRGDTASARTWFERSIRSGGWPAFGFILSEIELARLR
jgi:tetratricopeptide (TPR) repeat protein